MRVYIAGPMRGRPLYNFPAFFAAAIHLREAGYDVVSPAEIDMAKGFNPAVSLEENNFNMANALREDFKAILQCDGIVLLDEWEQSTGARIEWAMAHHAGLKILRYITNSQGNPTLIEHEGNPKVMVA